MKKFFTVVICFFVSFSLAACAGRSEEQPASVSEIEIEDEEANEQDSNYQPETANENRVLIAYFTWADNTEIQDEEAALESALAHYESVGDSVSSDVDAVTSASILQPGNAARIANWIQQKVGGDLFSIQVEEPYPDNYDACLDRAADEKAENARPALSARVENMEDYDTVFIGYPKMQYGI